MARPIVVQITGDARGFTSATQEASSAGGHFGHVMQGIAQGIGQGIFNLAVEGVHKVVDAVKESDKAFREDQVSAGLLGNTLRNTIPHWNGNTSAIEKYVAKQAELGFTADQVRNSIAKLSGVTHNATEAMRDEAMAQELARSKGLDLATATAIITKAHEGNAKALKSLGIQVTTTTSHVDALKASTGHHSAAELKAAEAADKHENAMRALKAIMDNTKGSAEAYANTSEGKLAAAQAKNQESWVKIGAVVDRFSTFILPYAAAAFSFIADIVTAYVAPAVSKLFTWFQDHLWPALQQVWAAAQQLGEVLRDFLAPMFTYIKDHIDTLKPVLIGIGIVFGVIFAAIVIVVIAVIVIVTALVVAIIWVAGKIREHITYLLTNTKRDLTAIGGFFSGVGTKAHELWTTVSTKFGDIVAFIKGVPAKITTAASGMWDGIKTAFKSALNWIIDKWNGLSFKIPSFDFLGQHTPGVTLSVPHIQRLHQGGTVQGSPGSDVLIMAQAGERVSRAGASSGGDIHIHIENWYGSQGPDLDRFANMIAARIRFAPGT